MNYTVCPSGRNLNYTDEQLDVLLNLKHYINGWTAICLIPIGIIANLITIITLLDKVMRQSSTNSYLLALTSSNLFSLICLFLMSALRFTLGNCVYLFQYNMAKLCFIKEYN
jgi:hypothetical protein